MNHKPRRQFLKKFIGKFANVIASGINANKGETENCAASMSTLSITPIGLVTGCGCIDWNNTHIMGDLNKNTLLEIWNQEKYKKFRNSFLEKNIPNICKNALCIPA